MEFSGEPAGLIESPLTSRTNFVIPEPQPIASRRRRPPLCDEIGLKYRQERGSAMSTNKR